MGVMRIAVSGTHRAGKTTLISELIGFLPTFNTVDEPYYQLEDEGHVFEEMPCLEDFELQLERSIESVLHSDENCLFDRCAADIVAYLIAHDDSDRFELNRWLPRVRDSMRRLDLVLFIPIEDPDRVAMSESDYCRLRKSVDEKLRDILVENQWDFGVPTIEVAGSIGERARQVLYRKHDKVPSFYK